MSKLTKEQAYCKMIDVLFAGAVRATPDEINNEVIRIVDTMFVEITKCHNMVKPIAVLFDGFATLYEGAVPDEIKLLVGSVTWQEYLLGKAQGLAVDRVADIIGKDIADPIAKTAKAVEVVKTFYDSWIKYSQKDRRMLLCINKARANWRSPLQIALMGL